MSRSGKVKGRVSAYEDESTGARYMSMSGKFGHRDVDKSNGSVYGNADAHAMRIVNKKTPGWDMDVKVGGASANFNASYGGAIVGARANLLDAKVGRFNAKLGVGVETGFQVEDASANMKLMGSGVRIGRHNEISVLGNSFGFSLF